MKKDKDNNESVKIKILSLFTKEKNNDAAIIISISSLAKKQIQLALSQDREYEVFAIIEKAFKEKNFEVRFNKNKKCENTFNVFVFKTFIKDNQSSMRLPIYKLKIKINNKKKKTKDKKETSVYNDHTLELCDNDKLHHAACYILYRLHSENISLYEISHFIDRVFKEDALSEFKKLKIITITKEKERYLQFKCRLDSAILHIRLH